ncbi:MAG: type II toxin-antitoxin system VapB family antitoxin [Sporichthyaceae bacterium]
MVLSIKNDEADRLARELAAETGETVTQAVIAALRERLEIVRLRRGPSMVEKLERLAAEIATLPVLDPRTPEDIIGYDENGLPT